MAMHSDKVYPSAPTKDGIRPRGLIFRYSSGTPFAGSVWTISRSSLLALATARIATERGLPLKSCEPRYLLAHGISANSHHKCTACRMTCLRVDCELSRTMELISVVPESSTKLCEAKSAFSRLDSSASSSVIFPSLQST